MADLISRQAAIEALYDWELSYTWDEHCKEDYDSPYIVSPSKVIDGLPSAQPEPQKWIDHNYYLECPTCARYVSVRTPFCPYCGGRNE